MKKQVEIWKNDANEQFGRLVDTADIITAIDCSQQIVYKFNTGVTEQDVLAAYAARNMDDYEDSNLADWIKSSELVDDEPDYLNVSDDSLCYEPGNGFFTAADWQADSFRMINFWDGSNWVRVYEPDENGEIIPVEYDPDGAADLDERDSNGNLNRGSNGLHHKAVKLDDGSVLVIHWSQWQGDFDTAAVMTAAEFDSYCLQCEISNPYQVKPTAVRITGGRK